MRTTLLIPFFMFCVSIVAQDVIITKDHQRIDAKIEEVSKEQIKYRKSNYPNGPLFIMSSREIQSLIYENGDVQFFDMVSSSECEKDSRLKEEKNKRTQKTKDSLSVNKKPNEKISVKRWFGISAGWVFKDKIMKCNELAIYDSNGMLIETAKDYKSETYGNTFQVGFTFAPTFKYGLGVYTGLYFEHTWPMKQINTWNPGVSYSGSGYEIPNKEILTEEPTLYNGTHVKWFGTYGNSLYIPIHFQYKYDFTTNINLLVSAGPSFEFGLDKLDSQDKRSKINILMGVRVGFQLYGAQVSLSTDWGLSQEKIIWLSYRYHRPLTIQISYMF